MSRVSEVNGPSLRIACIAGWAGCVGLEAPETGRFCNEVLVEQGRVDPKISTPHKEKLFHNYTHNYSTILQDYYNYTGSWNIIAYTILTMTRTYTCFLVNQKATSHPNISAHEPVIQASEIRQPKSGSRKSNRQVATSFSPLRDKRWLSRTALVLLQNFGFPRSPRMHKSSEIVSQIRSAEGGIATSKSCPRSNTSRPGCHAGSDIHQANLTGRSQVIASADRRPRAPEMRARKQYALSEASVRSLRKVDRGIGPVKRVREYLRRESPENRGFRRRKIVATCRVVRRQGWRAAGDPEWGPGCGVDLPSYHDPLFQNFQI